MTLREACEFGYDCINEELHELYVEARKYSPKMSIEEYLNGETSD